MIPIDRLPGESLLSIFDYYVSFYVEEDHPTKRGTEKWQTLVHVCRRWRSIVFGSPLRLNLRLYCHSTTLAKDTLDVWPALPIIIEGGEISGTATPDTNSIIAALSHNDRVCRIELREISSPQLKFFLPVMLVSFRELTVLRFGAYEFGEALSVPDSFLGGSAPRLRTLELDSVPFPGLPKLLLSTTHLVHLHLSGIFPSDLSPEEMVTCLSKLTNLKALSLQCSRHFHHFLPPVQSSRPEKRSTIPALTSFIFRGLSEYLEELVARIDTPQLNELFIHFLNKVDAPQLAQFIGRTPTLETSRVKHPFKRCQR